MLKNAIKCYLLNSKETEYEIPFRQLLWSLGYELLETVSIHHSFEFGKDIKALHSNHPSKVWLFQTKGGNISQSDWMEMERQLTLMIEMPPKHPNLKGDEHVQGVWVCTGDLAPTVQTIMDEFNKKYVAKGVLPIEVWNINKLVDKFEESFFSINICPESVVLELLALITSFNKDVFDLIKYQNLLEVLLLNIDQLKPKEIKQKLATCEIILHYILGRAYDVSDPYSAIQAIELTILKMWDVGKKLNFKYDCIDILDSMRDLLVTIIDELISSLDVLLKKENGLHKNSGELAEYFLYPHRTFEMMGLIGLRAWIAHEDRDVNKFNVCADYIEAVIVNNPSSKHPVWERAQEDILVTAFVLWKSGKTALASVWIKGMCDWLIELYVSKGGLARPTANPEEVIKQLLGIHLSFTDVNKVITSYLCYFMFELCYWFNVPEIYEYIYDELNGVHKVEMYYKNDDAIYNSVLGGQRYQPILPSTWQEFKIWYATQYKENDPTSTNLLTKELSENLWLFLVSSDFHGNRPFTFLFRKEIFHSER